MYSYIIMLIVCALPLQVIAVEHPTASELLDRYAATQDKLQSFISKCESSSSGDSSFLNKKDSPLYVSCEARVDGNRTNVRRQMWGRINDNIYTTKDNPLYQSRLWEGKTFFQHDRNTYNPRGYPGTVIMTKSKKINDKYNRGKNTIRQYSGVNLMGIFPNDDDRVDSMLRKANTISVRDETENIGGSNCYVIEADTKHGEYTVWIDPEHGYNIAKAIIKRGPGDVVFQSNYILPENDQIYSSLENVKFKKVDDVWVPVEADVKDERDFPDGKFHKGEAHLKITEFILNPEFKDSDFVPDDIPNGARVYVLDSPGITYTWQNGKLIPNIDRYAIETIDEMVGEFAKVSKDPNSITDKPISEAKPELVRITPTALLSKYRINQNKLKSFIAKGESTIESPGTTGQSIKGEMQLSEFRFDSDRVCHRATFWDNLVARKDNPLYKSFVWDCKSFITYRQGHKLKDNRVFVEDNDSSKNKMIATEYKGAALMGICGGDYERIDSILGQAYKISTRDRREQVGGSQCYVIDATTTRGQYTVWLDPKHGYNIAKVEVQRRKRNLVYDRARVKTGMSFSMKNVSFKQIDGVWVPMEADIQQSEDNQGKTTKWNHKRTEMILNPDHDSLGSFVADDIMDGTRTIFPGRLDTIEYIWQKGKPVLKVKSDVAR